MSKRKKIAEVPRVPGEQPRKRRSEGPQRDVDLESQASYAREHEADETERNRSR